VLDGIHMSLETLSRRARRRPLDTEARLVG